MIHCLFGLLILTTGLNAFVFNSKNEVTSLPGFRGKFSSRHFSGYVNVNKESNRTLFYYFVTSERDPARDPVVLWLNGGPGCSSFDGWIYEHGPFNFIPAKNVSEMPTLVENPYSWSKVANVLYVDSPAGVGLSYTSDYICSDLKTGKDLHVFLLKWFTEYSAFSGNNFFISGESYAGIYVPVLSREVATGIEAGIEPRINFKGYYIGNGCTDNEYDGDAFVPFIAGHGLISFGQQKKIEEACQGSYWNATGGCDEELGRMFDLVEGLNLYDILEPCYHSPASQGARTLLEKAGVPRSFRALGRSNPRQLAVRKRVIGRAFPLRRTRREGKIALWANDDEDLNVPCIDDRLSSLWMNNAAVRKSLHAKSVAEMGPWHLCTGRIEYFADAGSMIPIHRWLLQKGYRALIYSGDHDLCVPYTGSEKWVRDLGDKVRDPWRPWIVEEQVAGYTQSYANNITFATILGAGHTVPEYKPKESLHFHSQFIQDLPL